MSKQWYTTAFSKGEVTMKKYEFENEHGKYSLRIEREKKRGNAVIDVCINSEGIVSHLRKLGSIYECDEVYCTSKDDMFNSGYNYSYTIDSFDLIIKKKETPNYDLVPVTWENSSIYKDIYNKATFNVDNMSICDDSEVKEYLETQNAKIGLIKYKEDIIGTYTTMGIHEVDSFTIDPKFQGKHLAKEALQCVLNTLEDTAILFVSSRNERAIGLYRSMGFKKGNFTTKFYKIK